MDPSVFPGGRHSPDQLSTVHPRYGQASLADVLPSALAALGVPGSPDPLGLRGVLDGVQRIAVLLVDGLGTHQLPLAAPHAPTLADLVAGRLGSARTLTAGFPSTTPTSLVSLGTGAAPGAHGVLGFTVNVPGTDRLLTHIDWQWSPDGRHSPDKAADPDPMQWQPVRTQFARAAAAGVTTTAVSRPAFAGSGLTVAAWRGATYQGATGVDELAAGMLAALGGPAGRTLVYGYHSDVDTAGHLSGVDSEVWQATVSELDRLLALLVTGLPAGAALLVTADHGQLNVPPDCRFDCDADPRLRDGVRVVAGEARVRYVHTLPGATADVLDAWRGVLGAAASVVTREEAVAAGWFGAIGEAHLQRVGDVVAICRDRYVVVASRTEPPIASQLVAYHGSCTAAEMEIPLLIIVGGRG